MLYGTNNVARAAGVADGVVRSWLDRGLITMAEGGRDAAGRAQSRLFPIETALQVAVAAELMRLGFTASRATRLALSFSDSGTTDRLPGELFDDDKTILAVWPHLEAGKVIRASSIASIFAGAGVSAASAAFLDLNEVYRNTAARLGAPLPDAARNY